MFGIITQRATDLSVVHGPARTLTSGQQAEESIDLRVGDIWLSFEIAEARSLHEKLGRALADRDATIQRDTHPAADAA